MITNSHSIGGFRNLVGNDVEMDDGLFEVTLIKKPKNPLELNEIIAALINAYDDTDMIDAFKANSLYIHGDEAISWTLDGEFGGEHKAACWLHHPMAPKVEMPNLEGGEL